MRLDVNALLRERWPDPGVLYQEMVENSVHMWSVCDADGTTLYVNPACEDLVGYSQEELIGRNCIDLVHPDSMEIAITAFAEVTEREGGDTPTAGGPILIDLVHKDGRKVPVEVGSNPQLHNPVINGIILRCRLVASHALIERFLEKLTLAGNLEELLQPLVDALRLDIPVSHVALAYGWNGQAFTEVLTSELDASLAPAPGTALDPGGRWTTAMLDKQAIRDNTLDLLEPELRTAAVAVGYGSFWVQPVTVPPEGEILALLIVWREVEGPPWTSHELTIRRACRLIGLGFERRQNQRRLVHTATHDPLTDLPNRTLFFVRLEHALHDRRRPSDQSGNLAVLYLDLDGFKPINDRYGHRLGDEVLAEIGHRIVDAVRPQDLVARLGGDEFAVVCTNLAADDEVTVIAERLLDACAQPVRIDGEDVAVSASIGIASATPGVTPDELVHRADAAMYRAKQAGKGRWARSD